jgi:hypothetical protein
LLPLSGPGPLAEVAEPTVQLFSGGEYPHLVELASGHVLQPGYDFGDEVGFGLNLILDGLAGAITDN